MTNVKDLNIESDILAIFDNTYNNFTKNRLTDILLNPLKSIDEINNRQKILKVFLSNTKLLERYFYNARVFYDVHTLLTKSDPVKPDFRFKAFLFFNKESRNVSKGIYIELIVFLQQQYTFLSYLQNLSQFPLPYREELEAMRDYYISFELDLFNTLIRENKFKIRHIVFLKKKINELQDNENTKTFFKYLFTFESLLSISQTIHKRKFVFPSFGDNVFSIKGIYHPLLPSAVRNSIFLEKNIALITGPNMAGKSTLLKSIGISVYLGHLGLAIPAHEANFTFFDEICVYINHADNLQRGYSHFINEIKNLKEIVIEASKGTTCFAIFDEIFKGTNMNDALDITQTTLQGLAKFNKSVFFISTHMDELKNVEQNNLNSYFLDCKVENGIPVFNYQLNKGWSSVQIGKLLFKNEGLYEMLE